MGFDSAQFQQRLLHLSSAGEPPRYIVGFSGGLDSSVLLHALSRTNIAQERVLAVHINHGLHPEAGNWQQHCQRQAAALGVGFAAIEVAVDSANADGPEAAARNARYAAFSNIMDADDWLLTAHHQDDQAETLLINLLRGSGVAGLAAMNAARPFANGALVRPLLPWSRSQLQDYAERHNLAWLEDPSNAEQRFDRNFLRHETMLQLRERWPAASQRLARSADLAGEASELLNELADLDIEYCAGSDGAGRLSVERLSELSEARQRNVIRRAVKRANLAAVPERQIDGIVRELMTARPDGEPLVRWAGAEARRYRGFIFLQPSLSEDVDDILGVLRTGSENVCLGSLGQLSLVGGATPAIRPDLLDSGLQVRFRSGGEVLRPYGRQRTHKLKKLMQEKGVVPWMRERIPLLYVNNDLVAVADLWVADECAAPAGFGIEWRDAPAIF